MGEPDLVPCRERILSSAWQEDDMDGGVVSNMDGQCIIVSDRTSSGSDISTVLSNKYFTSDSYRVAHSDSDYGTADELCQMRGTDDYECRVERVRNPAQHGPGHGLTGLSNQVHRRDADRISSPSARRYYLTVIVLLYVG